MKHYLKIYLEFFKTSMAEASSYRLNFILLFLVDIAFYIINFAPIDFVFSHIDHIGAWNRDQFMFFISFAMVVDHLHMTLISGNFWMLANDLKLGNLDFTLLKPVHSIFPVFFRYVRVSSLASAPVVWFLLIYFAWKAQLEPLSWALLPLMILVSFLLMALIEILIATLMFWTTEGIGINFLRMQLQRLGQYPDFAYQTLTRRFFLFVLPVLLASSGPIHFLLSPQEHWPKLIHLALAIGIAALLLRKVWRIALNRYESASS